jgi:integrase
MSHEDTDLTPEEAPFSPPVSREPSRTPQTTAQYLRRAENLARNAKAELGLGLTEPIDPRQFVAWLAQRKISSKLTRPSWRQYKSAAICYLEHLGTDSALEARDWLFEIDVAGCAKRSDRTSATKLKRFPLKDYDRIMRELSEKPSKWSQPLADWLASSMLTGLRPQEWARAQVQEVRGEPALVVVNAKATNGRAHGPTRTIMLGGLSALELDLVRRHSDRARMWDGMGQFQELYEGCAQTLHQLCRRLWPRRSKHVTLYSCRHQFSANAKASGFSREEVAALMGHAVDTTATTHYGKKLAAQEISRVRPLPEDVQRVILKSQEDAGRRPNEPQPKAKAPANPQSPFAGPQERLF